MRVESATLDLSAQSAKYTREAERLNIRRWRGEQEATETSFSRESVTFEGELSQLSVERHLSNARRETGATQQTPGEWGSAVIDRRGGLLGPAEQDSAPPPSRRGSSLRPDSRDTPLPSLARETMAIGELLAGELEANQSVRDPSASMHEELTAFLDSVEGVELFTLRRLLEETTGRKLEAFRPLDLEVDEEQKAHVDRVAAEAYERLDAARAGSGPRRQQARVGWGLEVEAERMTETYERVEFSASGVVETADGHRISLEASFSYEHHEVSISRFEMRAGDARMKDPLMLVFDGNLPELTDQVTLDIDADGEKENVAFAFGNAAALVLDHNQNGHVDDGSELFGAISGDGFADLRALDEDGNGWVDEADSQFGNLQVWLGRSSSGQDHLVGLSEQGIGALYTGSAGTDFELHNDAGELQGAVRQTGVYLTEQGAVRPLQQLDLKV